MKNNNKDESSSHSAKRTMMSQDLLEEKNKSKNETSDLKKEKEQIIKKIESKKDEIKIEENKVEDKKQEIESKKDVVKSTENRIEDKTENKLAPFQVQKKKGKNLAIVALLLSLFIAIILIAVYFFGDRIFKKETPQEIINSSIEATSNVKSFSFAGNFDFDFANNEDTTSLAMKFDGKLDRNNPDDIKGSLNIKPEIDVSKEGGSESFSLDLSTMFFDGTDEEAIYLKLNAIDLGTVGLMLGGTIAPYKNKWYFWDITEIKEEMEKDNSLDVQREKVEKIKEIFKKYELLKFQENLGDTEINSKKVYHYQAKIDSEELLNCYLEVIKEVSEFDLNEIEKDEFEETKKEILAYLDEVLKNIEIEIWIGKKDRLIYQVYVHSAYDEKDMERITKITLGKARTKAVDATIKSEVSGKQPELIIHCDDNNGDCRGFKSKYWGSTVSPKYQIEQHIETGENYSYVIWSELCSTTDKWCVDSENNSGYFLGEIEGTKCPDNMSSVPQGEKRNCTLGMEDDSPLENIRVSSKITLTMSGFNQPINLTKPEESENLLEVLEEMAEGVGSAFMGGMTPGPSSGFLSDSDSDGLTDSMEEFYGTDKNNPDTDGDGYLDGGEVDRGYSPTIPGDARL